MLNERPRFISTPSRGRNQYALTKIKENIRERSGYTCDYCGEEGKQVEHINPVSNQGINDPRNLIIACEKCNQDKGDDSVTEFLARRDDLDTSIEDLPIYGDLILSIPDLPAEYTQVRRETIIQFRKQGRFSGGDAYKELEKSFRRNLWETDFGYWLCLRYPGNSPVDTGMPGQRRVSIPLIEYLISDTRIPIYDLLLTLTESAATRHLIDDMAYYKAHEKHSTSKSIRLAINESKGATEDKLNKKLDGTQFSELEEFHFEIAEEIQNIPVYRRKLELIDLHDFREAGGHIRGGVDGFEVRVPKGEASSDVPVRITKVTPEYAEAIPLSYDSSPAIEYNKERAKQVIRKYTK
jgi:hypothetical protein